MKNIWLDEIRLKSAVKLLEVLVSDEFTSQPANQDSFSVLEEIQQYMKELVDALYGHDDAIISGLQRYQFVLHLDDFGFIRDIELFEQV